MEIYNNSFESFNIYSSDKFNTNRDLRFVLTQNCNYNCIFCHGEGIQTKQGDCLDSNDYAFLFHIGKKFFGIDSTTLTGGEPLFRKDAIDIAKSLKKLGSRITVVTNGELLDKKEEIGRYIDRINLSLHSLKKDEYEKIVGRKNTLRNVINNALAIKAKFPNIELRLNSTLLQGVNSNELDILDFLKFSKLIGSSIKFVELFPQNLDGHVSLDVVRNLLRKLGYELTESSCRTESFRKDGHLVILTKIVCDAAKNSSTPSSFCRENSDLFINPNGTIKPCREINEEISIIKEIKNRNEDATASKIMLGFSKIGEKCILENK